MAVMIGVDPHKGSHTAVAIDGDERGVRGDRGARRRRARSRSCWRGRPRSRSGRGRSRVLAGSAICSRSSSSRRVNRCWTCRRRSRRGCGCWGRAVRTRTTRTMATRSQSRRCARRRSSRCRRRITRACCGCSRSATSELGGARTRSACRLHALLVELVPGRNRQGNHGQSRRSGCSTSITPSRSGAKQPDTSWRSSISRTCAASTSRCAPRSERIAEAVRASGTTVTELFGFGPGRRRDRDRLHPRRRAGSRTGTSSPRTTAPHPIEVSSGGRIVHRLSRRGNRQLNHAIHIAAITQIRHHPLTRPRRTTTANSPRARRRRKRSAH